MTWPARIGISASLVALFTLAAVLWLSYGEGVFVEHMLASLAGCF
ncbi:hypothetical protein [Amorphus orientalis]|uniref:Uncharacterized protein n=1 Tax=Amorphus orientalis TaxID=649198 RepID=A0AAE3VMF0_9HYPH|nr:hypothetical protein [Amorphus orientalis]MDQ0314361.1 hypothetical protein [Amorphus orientalis]